MEAVKLTSVDWTEIKNAYEYLVTSQIKRIDSDKNNWSIYKIGLTIRLDIK